MILMPSFLLLACSGDTTADSGHGDEDPAEHACELFEEGSTTTVAASATAEGDEGIEPSEDALSVTLVDDGSGVFGGYLLLDVHEAELDALLFAGTADVVSGLWLDGEDQGLPTAAPNEFCGEDIVEHCNWSSPKGSTLWSSDLLRWTRCG